MWKSELLKGEGDLLSHDYNTSSDHMSSRKRTLRHNHGLHSSSLNGFVMHSCPCYTVEIAMVYARDVSNSNPSLNHHQPAQDDFQI